MPGVPVVPAHGALGNLDEVVFLLVAVIFLAMMSLSWVRSRNLPPEEAAPDSEPSPEAAAEDRFELR